MIKCASLQLLERPVVTVMHHVSRVETPNIYRDRTEEWYYPQQESNKRARFMLGMNETAPEGETESSLKYYGMGDVR